LYGETIGSKSSKPERVGTGPFTLIIVEDSSPVVEGRFQRGILKFVNSKIYDLKEKYRGWAMNAGCWGKDLIHASVTTDEFNSNITLFFGRDQYDFKESISSNDKRAKINGSLVGTNGWASWEQFFTVINANLCYVVLRNFEDLPDHLDLSRHGDIDFLVDDRFRAKLVMDAKPLTNDPTRVHYEILVNDQAYRVDLRHVGDGYLDHSWEHHILRNREISKRGFFRPSDEDYYFSLLYHALFHKKEISDEYLKRLQRMAKDLRHPTPSEPILLEFMDKMLYRVLEPVDRSVYFRLRPRVVGRRERMKNTIKKGFYKIARRLDNFFGKPKILRSSLNLLRSRKP